MKQSGSIGYEIRRSIWGSNTLEGLILLRAGDQQTSENR